MLPPSPAEQVFETTDLLTEILSHIPTKPLLCFKSINTTFHSIISHPQFSRLHSLLHHHHHPSSALFLHHHHHPSLSPLYHFIPLTSTSTSHHPPFLTQSPTFDILQSCNGLLLCSSAASIIVCNPTTTSTTTLTLPPPHNLSSFLGLNLRFDPLFSPHYHLLCVSTSNIHLYSSQTRQWRLKAVDFTNIPFDVEFDHGVYWENRIYWLSHTENSIFFDFESDCVGSFDLPKAVEGAYIQRFRYFGESFGHLHLIEIRTNSVDKFDVFELNKMNKNEWFVKYRVNLDVLGIGFEVDLFQDHFDRFGRGLRFYAFSILAVVEDVDDSALVISIPGKVVKYNFRTKVSKLLCNVVDESDKLFPLKRHNAFQFIESLYCVRE